MSGSRNALRSADFASNAHQRWPQTVDALNETGTDSPRNDDEQLVRLVRWFEDAERATMTTRELSLRDRAYVNADQWTQAEREALRNRGQPIITINYCRRKLDMLCGLERRARTDPKAFPRTPAEDDRADAATQALRYVADDNDYSRIRSLVFEDMLVEGFGGIEVGLEDDQQGGANVTLTWVPWDRLWYDPHSRMPDFSDARYKGIVVWMDRDQLFDMYPDAGEVIEGMYSGYDASQYRDRPDYLRWTDNQRLRVRVVQCHWLDHGEWVSATFTKGGYLTEPTPSLFKDRRGNSACSLIMQSGYIDHENNRYGMIRDLISLQDMINKRESKALHLLSVHQVIAEQGAVKDVDQARREVAKPDGYVEVMPGMKFEIQPGGDLAQGQFQLLQHATQEMQLAGPNAAMSGTDPRELSGRAILAQQAGGSVQNEPLADSLRMWSRRVYETIWMAVREYWTAGKWVRVTDELQETRWVGINRPITLMDELANMPDQQRAQVMQQMQLVPDDPRLQQVIRIDNDITDLDVDITIQEGQDIPTLQAETFQTLVQLASMQPGLIPGDVLIAASSLRNKEQLLARMKDHMQQQQQASQQQGQVAQQMASAKIQDTQARAAASQALAQERMHNVVHGAHDMLMDLNAPPDNPQGAGPQPPSPEQMTPDVALAHHIADLAQKHANIRKTQADTALQAMKANQVPAQNLATHAGVVNTLHQAANTAVQTDRLQRTPIPQPQPATP
ncbi:MAG TPA: hypothetical protein VGI78_02275 [Acetobacteraceae bacterium]|jgi:hypothetical protein